MIIKVDFIEGSYTAFIEKDKDLFRVEMIIDSLSSSHVYIWLFIDVMLLIYNIN